MNLNLITSLDPTGYGYVGRFILNELTSAGVQVALFPLSYSVFVSDDPQDPVRLGLANAGRYDPSAPSVRIAQARMLAEHVGRGKHAGFPIFELDRLDASEIHHLKQLDAILVCSKWAAGVVASSGISVPTVVAPLGVDRSIFHEAIGEARTRDEHREPGPTIFVNNGKWEWRKGHDFLLQAFCNAFTPRRQRRAEAIEPQPRPLGPGQRLVGESSSSLRVSAPRCSLCRGSRPSPRSRLCSRNATAASSRPAPRAGTSGCSSACRSA